jgi:hypothetical protein
VSNATKDDVKQSNTPCKASFDHSNLRPNGSSKNQFSTFLREKKNEASNAGGTI